MSGEIVGGVHAVTPQAAAALFAMEHRDQLAPDWTFTVMDNATGEVSVFKLSEDGDVVPADLFPVM